MLKFFSKELLNFYDGETFVIAGLTEDGLLAVHEGLGDSWGVIFLSRSQAQALGRLLVDLGWLPGPPGREPACSGSSKVGGA